MPRWWPRAFTCTSAANGEGGVRKMATPVPASPMTHDEILALTDRAQNGDHTALPALEP
jgi:hypothetical protein